jgi:chromosome segregation ATPase
MTIEEITHKLETVDENQEHTTQPKTELEATVQQIAQFHQDVLKDHEARHAKLDEAIRIAVELLRTQEVRIDGHDDAHSETDAHLKVLIGSQIFLDEKFDKLTSDIVAIGRRFDQMAVRLDQVIENVDRLTSSIAAVNVRVDWVGDRLDRIGEYVELHSQHLVQIDERLNRMSEHIEAYDKQLTRIGERIDQADKRA